MKKKVEVSKKGFVKSRVVWWFGFTCLVGLAGVCVQKYLSLTTTSSTSITCVERLKYWPICLINWNLNGNLRSMDRVFNRLGYETVDGFDGQDWDVIWSFDYPFKLINETSKLIEKVVTKLKPHQLVNHIPGINYITSKHFMNTQNQDLPYILKSFRFPLMIEIFKAFIKENPEKKIVSKGLQNRGVLVVNKTDVDYNNSLIFYQEFIDKPLLIHDRVFDLGIYVLISSIDPLRIYRYDQEVVLRFCSEPYHPFDEKNIEKYVVYETHKHYCELSSHGDEFGFSHQKYLERSLSQQGHDFGKLTQQIDKAIVELILKNENNFIKRTSQMYESSRNFFELVRFDFVLDENLKLYLMEVNMSPNLTPMYARFENNAPTCEQIIHKTLVLVGAGSYVDLMSSNDDKTNKMQSNSRNIAVDLDSCMNNKCLKSCNKIECNLCKPCLNSNESMNLHRAYREHMRRGDFKRIFPSKNHFEEDFISSLTPANQIATRWFKAKCRENSDWC